jgi:hypothetical protein
MSNKIYILDREVEIYDVFYGVNENTSQIYITLLHDIYPCRFYGYARKIDIENVMILPEDERKVAFYDLIKEQIIPELEGWIKTIVMNK